MSEIRPYEKAFPFFSDDLPVIEGFEDSTQLFDRCPNLTNRDIGLRIYVDTANAEDSSLKHLRSEDKLGRYTVYEITDDGHNCHDWSLTTNNYEDVTAFIDLHDFLLKTPAC